MRDAGSWAFPQVSGVGSERAVRGKARWEGVSGGSESCRERRAVAAPRCGGSIGRVLVGLRNGESGGREPLWDSRFGPVGRLTGGVTRRLRSGCVSEARMTAKGVL